MKFSKKLPRDSDGFGILNFDVASDQLSAQPQDRYQICKKIICTVLALAGDWTDELIESKHSICDVNASTIPMRYPSKRVSVPPNGGGKFKFNYYYSLLSTNIVALTSKLMRIPVTIFIFLGSNNIPKTHNFLFSQIPQPLEIVNKI